MEELTATVPYSRPKVARTASSVMRTAYAQKLVAAEACDPLDILRHILTGAFPFPDMQRRGPTPCLVRLF